MAMLVKAARAAHAQHKLGSTGARQLAGAWQITGSTHPMWAGLEVELNLTGRLRRTQAQLQSMLVISALAALC